jgi:hypothetical protein
VRAGATTSEAVMAENPPAEELPPYVIEGARSSRSKCKSCRRKIDKDVLRIGFLIEGPYGTGYLWHHLKCAAKRHFDRVEEAYAARAWEQAKQPPNKVPELDALRSLQAAAEENRRTRKFPPYVELAPSGRSKCKHCEELIEKGNPRVALGRGVYFGSQVRIAAINVHPSCVAGEMRSEDCSTEVEGFAESVRENTSDVDSAVVDAVLAEIGDLS